MWRRTALISNEREHVFLLGVGSGQVVPEFFLLTVLALTLSNSAFCGSSIDETIHPIFLLSEDVWLVLMLTLHVVREKRVALSVLFLSIVN